MRREIWSDEQMVKAILEGGSKRKKALSQIYNNDVLEQRIKNLIKHKGGSNEDAEEIYIESIVLADRNIRNEKFKGESSISTYIYSIAKFAWFNLVRTKKTDLHVVSLEKQYEEITDHANPELLFIDHELKEKLERLVNLLSEKCQIILKLWSNNAKYDEIAEALGVEKGGSLRKQKLMCLRKLKEHLIMNPGLIPKYYHGGI